MSYPSKAIFLLLICCSNSGMASTTSDYDYREEYIRDMIDQWDSGHSGMVVSAPVGLRACHGILTLYHGDDHHPLGRRFEPFCSSLNPCDLQLYFHFYRNKRSDRFRMTYAEIEGTCCWKLCNRDRGHCEYIELGRSREINIFAYAIEAGDCDHFDDYY